MAINTNPMFEFGRDLTPEQLAQMLALKTPLTSYTNPDGVAFNSGGGGSLVQGDKFSPDISFDPAQVNRGTSVGADAEYMNDPSGAGKWWINQPRNISTWGGSDATGVWDDTGKWQDFSTGMTDLRGLATILAMAAGGAYTNGGFGAGTSGGGAAAGSTGLTGWDAAMGDLASSGGLTAGDFAAGTAATGGAVGGGAAGGGAGGTGTTSALTGAKSLVDGLGGAKGLVTLAGGIAGAADGGDKTTSSTRDPWAPAQDFLKQQLAQGQQLSTQYQQNPFSQSQQTAYGNLGGLLDSINSNAGGLLGGFGANASGANNYDRNNPRRPLTGGTAMNLQGWMPGLLGNFGTTKG